MKNAQCNQPILVDKFQCSPMLSLVNVITVCLTKKRAYQVLLLLLRVRKCVLILSQKCLPTNLNRSKALIRHNILTHNIMIKRHISYNISFCCVNSKYFWGTFLYNCLHFENILKCNNNILTKNIFLL